MMRIYDTPEALAKACGAPFAVCSFVFAAAGYDPEAVALIRSDAREMITVEMRRAVVWCSKFHTSATLLDIGKALNRDHSTVLRCLYGAKLQWLNDADFRGECERLAVSRPRQSKQYAHAREGS